MQDPCSNKKDRNDLRVPGGSYFASQGYFKPLEEKLLGVK